MWQALVSDLRTIWTDISNFEIERVKDFLINKPSYAITLSLGVDGNLIV